MHDNCQETGDGNGNGHGNDNDNDNYICSNVMKEADWANVVVVIVLVMMVVMISMSLQQMLHVLDILMTVTNIKTIEPSFMSNIRLYVSSPSTDWSGFVMCGVVVA